MGTPSIWAKWGAETITCPTATDGTSIGADRFAKTLDTRRVDRNRWNNVFIGYLTLEEG
jgi:hypothetical protein